MIKTVALKQAQARKINYFVENQFKEQEIKLLFNFSVENPKVIASFYKGKQVK